MNKPGRQSKDFNEILNIQTTLNVTNEKWDSIFHNWDNPLECNSNKRPTGCTICNELKKGNVVINNNKKYTANILIVGDIHKRLDIIHKLMNKYDCPIISTGDLDLNLSDKIDKLPYPLYIIKGNHDIYNISDIQTLTKYNIIYPGNDFLLNNKILIFGGIYSSKKTYQLSSTLEGKNKRFFTIEDIEKILNNNRGKQPNILITHQAIANILPLNEKIKVEEGCELLNKLVDTFKPFYYIHGHHHITYNNMYGKIKCFGLSNLNLDPKAYVIYNLLTNEIYNN